MSSGPLSLGTRIRRARERRRLTQLELAEAVGVSVRAVSDWERDRTRPKNRLGVLEEFFGVSLTEPDDAEVYTDPVEQAIWEDESIPDEADRRAVIEEIRERRRRHGRRAHDRRAG